MSSTAPSACGWRAPAAWTKSSGSSGSARGTWAGRRRSSWTTFASYPAGGRRHVLSRVIRLCLCFGVEPVSIPAGEPQFNGGVQNFNGWFQPRLFQRRFTRPGDLRRELARLQEAVDTQHVHPRLGGLTPAQHRLKSRLSKLPASFVVPTDRQPIAAGRVTLYPASEPGRDGHRAQPVVPSGEEASGPLPAPGDRHRTGTADGVPQWASAEALALQVAEPLTDT